MVNVNIVKSMYVPPSLLYLKILDGTHLCRFFVLVVEDKPSYRLCKLKMVASPFCFNYTILYK